MDLEFDPIVGTNDDDHYDDGDDIDVCYWVSEQQDTEMQRQLGGDTLKAPIHGKIYK